MRSIGRTDNSDPCYRYKMPVLALKHEGSGNGVKTVLLNIEDISKSLHIETKYLLKYMSIELGARVHTKDTRHLIAGTYSSKELNLYLDKFIAEFLLCPDCKDPEVQWEVDKKDLILDCRACGYRKPLKSGHRLLSYIMKHPPTVKVRDATLPHYIDVDVKDAKHTIDDFLSRYVSEEKDITLVAEELDRACNRKGKQARTLLKAICSNPKDAITRVEKYAKLFLPLVSPQRFLQCFSSLASSDRKLLVRVPHLLQAFYEHDVLDEDVILQWYNTAEDPVREKACPFIEWLRTAEEEEV